MTGHFFLSFLIFRMILNTFRKYFIVLACCCTVMISCKTTGYGYAIKDEKAKLKINESPDAINYAALKPQEIPSLSDRAQRGRGPSRGMPLATTAVSLATDVIKKMIANDRKKYIADYSFALTDLYFYDQLSTESVFDPVGMQFSGFKLTRSFKRKDGITDTAFMADFVLDTTRPAEIINNSIFRLRLKDLQLKYAKAKTTKGQKNMLNMDIEIIFTTSYVNEWGQLFDNVELGRFYFLLRDAPLDKNSPGYNAYYHELKGKLLVGKSFIAPRSFGYHLVAPGKAEKSYSQGAYAIAVKIKESTKDKFVTKLLMDNSTRLLDLLSTKAKSALTPKDKPVTKNE